MLLDHFISSQTNLIRKIIYSRLMIGEKVGSPTKIIETMCEKTGLPVQFYRKGFNKKENKNKMKKKLDNLISEEKKHLPEFIANMYTKEQLQNLLFEPEQRRYSRKFLKKKTKTFHEID